MRMEDKARELLDTEKKIYDLMQKAGRQVDTVLAGAKMPSMVPVVVPAVISAGLLLAISVLRQKGIVVIVLVLALLFMLGKVYSNWQNYSMRKASLGKMTALTRQSRELEKERTRLIGELNGLRNDAGRKRYWWDLGLDPAFTPRMPGQPLPAGDDWKLGLFHEIQLETKEDGIYLHDFLKTPLFCTKKYAEAMRQGKTAELYRDDAVYASDATAYVCKHLYAYHLTPIEEIEGHTTVRKVNREQVLAEYRSQVDDLERMGNMILGNDYFTNEEAYMLGRMSVYDHNDIDTWRRLAEYDFKEKIPDEIRHTHYTQSFRNLWYMEFLSCAVVFLAADGSRAGQTALILHSNEEQESLGFTVRTNSAEEMEGYLESYAGLEPLEVGGTCLRPSLAVFAGTLFGSSYRESLRLRRRDLLGEKPSGLTDEEWAYLIRTDMPR